MPTTEPFGISAAAASADITFAFSPLWRTRLAISVSLLNSSATRGARVRLGVLRGCCGSEGGEISAGTGALGSAERSETPVNRSEDVHEALPRGACVRPREV